MTTNLTRPRLMASLLCLLIAAAAAILFATSRFAPTMLRQAESVRAFDVQAEPSSLSMTAPPGIDGTANDVPASPPPPEMPATIRVTQPRIAYNYGYIFRLDPSRIAAVQEGHLAMCRGLGPALCRVTAMQRGGASGAETGANLKLQVAASLAERFGRGLIAAASEGGGETLDRSIAAEDLSGQMIDSEARIRTREILIQRLTLLLQTRSGNIEQAVAAERAINEAQEELEAARAALADMRGRVAMSAVDISYVARGAAPDPGNPIAHAFGQVAATAASSLGAMILIVGITFPWAIVGGLLFLLARAIRRRREPGGE